jgi:hypothetical protein
LTHFYYRKYKIKLSSGNEPLGLNTLKMVKIG